MENNESFPLISSGREKTKKVENKINLGFYDINDSLKDFFDGENNKNENILSKYIKKYYNNRKKSGYIGLVNIENNKFLKKK